MVSERIQDAGSKSVSQASTQVLDRSRPLEHQHRFQMVLVVHLQFLTSEHGGHVKGKAHSVALQQQSRAFPAIGLNIAVGGEDILSFSYYHIGIYFFRGYLVRKVKSR